MDFTNAPGFRIFYYFIMAIIWIAVIIGLVRSAIASLKRTGGKISSIFDEIIVGGIVTVAFVIIAMQSPSMIISWIAGLLKWVWGILLDLFRFVGLPV